MIRLHTAALALLALLAGCQAPYPHQNLTHYGAGVRATLASQVVAPLVRPDQGADGAAATAAYSNYQHSYVTPTPQADSPTFGSK